MTDLHAILNRVSRPRLLVRAARRGVADYQRERHLPRILKLQTIPQQDLTLRKLAELEATHEQKRRDKDATYSIPSHIETLIALMAELRTSAYENASATSDLRRAV